MLAGVQGLAQRERNRFEVWLKAFEALRRHSIEETIAGLLDW
jgi:hypothetical protein